MLHLNPSASAKESCLRNFVANLWDVGKANALVSLHYGELTEQLIGLLEDKCKGLHPMNDAGFFETIYAFHMHRYNYEAGKTHAFVRLVRIKTSMWFLAARIMYCLSWRLRWEAQSADVLARRLQILACVCQTVELLPADYTITFDLKGYINISDDEEKGMRLL